jgi:hypothetical protein
MPEVQTRLSRGSYDAKGMAFHIWSVRDIPELVSMAWGPEKSASETLLE